MTLICETYREYLKSNSRGTACAGRPAWLFKRLAAYDVVQYYGQKGDPA